SNRGKAARPRRPAIRRHETRSRGRTVPAGLVAACLATNDSKRLHARHKRRSRHVRATSPRMGAGNARHTRCRSSVSGRLTMRKLGQLMMFLGASVGVAVGLGILFGVALPGVSWIVGIGLAKLSLVASGGVMAGGGGLHTPGYRPG